MSRLLLTNDHPLAHNLVDLPGTLSTVSAVKSALRVDTRPDRDVRCPSLAESLSPARNGRSLPRVFDAAP